MSSSGSDSSRTGSQRTSTLQGMGVRTASDRPSIGAYDVVSQGRGLQPGMIVAGKFALVRRLERDATTETFEAEDTLMGRRVALRVLHPELNSSADAVRRFRREAHATASVSHPAVVTVLEIGRRSDGALFVVQELLEGPTLAAQLEATPKMAERAALVLMRPITGALAAAHARGVFHRAVSPAKVVLARAPFAEAAPKLFDFRIGRPAAPAESPYLAPEQVTPEGWVDGRADVWAVGAILYELLSGKRVASDCLRLDSIAPDLRQETIDLVHRCLERDSGARPEMQAVYVEVARLTDGPPVSPEDRITLRPAPGPVEDEIILSEDDVEEIELIDVDPDDEDSPQTLRPRVANPYADEDAVTIASGGWSRATQERDAVGGDFARGSAEPMADADAAADAAQRALRVNMLEEAVVHAEAGIAAPQDGSSPELLGQLHLVRAIAEHWLGHHQQSLQAALAAMEVLARASTGWFAAFGHAWLARANLGRLDILPDPAESAVGTSRTSAAHVIAMCRLSVAMIRAGSLARARQLVRAARERLDRVAASEPLVLAWLEVSIAERAAFVGDLAQELPRRSSAVERFIAGGDVRNACEQRAAMGATLVRLGAFDEAERMLHDALRIAQPMKLGVASVIKAYLGLAAFRQGEADRALSLGNEALEELQASGDRYREATCHTFLALIHALHDDLPRAVAAAEAAVAAAEPFPAVFCHALGVQAATLVFAGKTHQALRPATHAMELLAERGGAGEGESLLRLTNALVLADTGDKARSRKAMKGARDRLIGLAERFGDPRHKKSFLERISENARILQLGAEWLEDAR